MIARSTIRAASTLAHALAIALVAAPLALAPQPASAQSQSQGVTTLSVGRGQLVDVGGTIKDIYVADEKVADVQVRSARQLYIFGRGPGETNITATDASGRTLFTTTARVGNNLTSIDQMLSMAMPDARVVASTMNGMVLLTGTVASPEEAEDAERLVAAFVGKDTQVISRLQTATPLQVNLQVRIAEVNRTLVKEINGNILTRDSMGSGFIGGIGRGRDIGTITDTPYPTAVFPGSPVPRYYDPYTGELVTSPRPAFAKKSIERLGSLMGAGRIFGVDVLTMIDLGERAGMVTTLAQPNLTALSGETAEFLAGGEFPIPVPSGLGDISIQYRQYGVSLAYTPTVLASGRISLRVRPEVSELTEEGAIRSQGINIPGLTVRRAETTVELGSGESFMIAGLLNNRSTGTIDKIPGLGDVPVLGTLFKSDNYRRGETELVIVVTPYLVRPVSANQIRLPTDGLRDATDLQRVFLNQTTDGRDGEDRPKPTRAPPAAQGARPVAPGDAAPGFSSQ